MLPSWICDPNCLNCGGKGKIPYESYGIKSNYLCPVCVKFPPRINYEAYDEND
jgi:hypothetical protein